MAYDQASSYQAPARGYYAQPQPQQYAQQYQQDYNGPRHQQHHDDPRSNHADYGTSAPYAQGRGPPYAHTQQRDGGHAQGYPRQDQYGYDARSGNGYGQADPYDGRGQQQYTHQPNNYLRGSQPQGQPSYDQQSYQQYDQRRYDPRYQQRGDQPTQSYQQQPRQYQQEQMQQPISPPRGHAPSQQAPQHLEPQKTAPKKLSMEEWKAQEKAKMHQAAGGPKVSTQDNAFPTFPTKKAESSRSGGQSAMSRRSEEQSRPVTASSLRPDERRPGTSRENSYKPELADSARPSLDQKASQLGTSSARPSVDSQHRPHQQSDRPEPLHQTMYRPHQQSDRQEPPQQMSHRQYQPNDREDYSQQVAYRSQQQSDRHDPSQQIAYRPHQHNDRQTPPQQTMHRPHQQSDRQTPPQQITHHPPPPRKDSHNSPTSVRSPPSPSSARPAGMSIDTGQAQHNFAPAQPLSPSHERPLPPDSRYARRPSEQQPMSPLGKFSQSAHAAAGPTSPLHADLPSPVYQQPQHQSIHSAIDDVYDEYNGEIGKPGAASANSRTRAEEIEAEMPDFDSAAPSQTSALHKRNQTVDKHLHGSASTEAAPPLPAMPSRAADSFDFGFGGGQQRPQPPTLAHPSVSDYTSLVSAPFANETPVRASMDSTRTAPLPYRDNAPSARPVPQRIYPDSTRRPSADRQVAPTPWADPAMQRSGSAPPRPDARSGYGIQPQNASNPDALPAHPTPVRPGLMNGDATPAPHPAPVRNYDGRATPQVQQVQQQQARPASGEAPETPITQAELQRIRAELDANPNSNKLALLYAKKLVEAAKVLASDGGRNDPKTTAKNRERYIMEAYKRVKKLASAGYPDAQFYLADCYSQGALGLDTDPKEAFRLYQSAAKAGHGTAAYRTAVCCEMGAEEGGGTSRDFPRAFQWYKRAAALGETAAMFKVGMISLKGLLGQPRHLGEASIWLKRAAERADKANPHALHELGVLYESANSTPELRHKIIPDDAYALQLYKQAADFGYKHSQFRMGQAFEYGHLGLPIDHRASISWYSKAAAQGEHQAELALSGWYLTGAPGILQPSDTEAYLWARKAARAEPPLAKAMFAMGYFQEMGIGCPVNVEEAKRWYGRAASYKHPKAAERLEAIRRGVKGGYKGPAVNGKLARKDQKHDEAECVVM